MSSLKKHYSQLKSNEKNFLMNRLTEVRHWKLSKHLKCRMDERGGNTEKIKETLENGTLIEFHQRDGKSRVLIRGNTNYKGNVLCVVFQFQNRKIITLYWNAHDDNHSTLREKYYNEKLNVIELYKKEFKEIRKQQKKKTKGGNHIGKRKQTK